MCCVPGCVLLPAAGGDHQPDTVRPSSPGTETSVSLPHKQQILSRSVTLLLCLYKATVTNICSCHMSGPHLPGPTVNIVSACSTRSRLTLSVIAAVHLARLSQGFSEELLLLSALASMYQNFSKQCIPSF